MRLYLVSEVITCLWRDSSLIPRKNQGFQHVTESNLHCLAIIQYMIISFPKSTGITLWRGNFYFPRGTNTRSGLEWYSSINSRWYRQSGVLECMSDTEREGRENASFLDGQQLPQHSCRFMLVRSIDLIRDWCLPMLLSKNN